MWKKLWHPKIRWTYHIQYRCWRPPSRPKPPRSQTRRRTWTVAFFDLDINIDASIDFFQRIESMRRYVGTSTCRIFKRWSPDSEQIPSWSQSKIAEIWPKPPSVHVLLQVGLRDVKSWCVVPLSIKPQRSSKCLSLFFLLLQNAPYTLPKCFSKRNFKKSENFGTEYPL